MEFHKDIKKKLKYFIEEKKIPHIIFHGPSGSGKRKLLDFFIKNIYSFTTNYKKYVMYINCAHGKGIRFIRDELKFFAKTNILNKHGNIFKSIVLFNGDKLTTDAQSALRRCIEQFSHTTRFFVIIDDHKKLLKPIISRFCNIRVPLPVINNEVTSFHEYKNKKFNNIFNKLLLEKDKWLIKALNKKSNFSDINTCYHFTDKIYEKGYSGLDLMNVIEISKKINPVRKYGLLIHFDTIRREFRNEKLIILYILTLTFMRPNVNLENIKTM